MTGPLHREELTKLFPTQPEAEHDLQNTTTKLHTQPRELPSFLARLP
jgi:hypothetical protein